MLDLYAGSGAMGLEALSRGAATGLRRDGTGGVPHDQRQPRQAAALGRARPLPGRRPLPRHGDGHLRPRLLRPVRTPQYDRLEPQLARDLPRLLADDGLLVLETVGAPARPRAPARGRRGVTAPRGLASSRANDHRDLSRHVRPRDERAHRRDRARRRRSSTASSSAWSAQPRHKAPMFTLDERVAFLNDDGANRERRGRRLLGARRRLRAQVGREGDLKGLSVISDFEWEFQMNQLNRVLAPEIETVYVMASPSVSLSVERREGDRPPSGEPWTSWSRRRSRIVFGSCTPTPTRAPREPQAQGIPLDFSARWTSSF